MGIYDGRSDRRRLTGFLSGIKRTNDRTLRQSIQRKTMLLIRIIDFGEYIIILTELQEMPEMLVYYSDKGCEVRTLEEYRNDV